MNNKAYVFIGMGFELVGAVLGFMWLGGKLDAALIVVRSLANDSKTKQIDGP